MNNRRLDLRILKPANETTAVLEIRNKGRLLAKVFTRHDGVRYFHLPVEGAVWGPHWGTLSRLAKRADGALDVADEEMRQDRASAALQLR